MLLNPYKFIFTQYMGFTEQLGNMYRQECSHRLNDHSNLVNDSFFRSIQETENL
jgi:hypothetical protein